MRKNVLITLVVIAVVSLFAIGAAYMLPKDVPQSMQSKTDTAPPLPDEEPVVDSPYMLRTYEGKLAVFSDNPVVPDLIFEVYVRTLPQKDQEDLRVGIPVETFDELNTLIEDFIS